MHTIHSRDLVQSLGQVYMQYALMRKYSKAATELSRLLGVLAIPVTARWLSEIGENLLAR